MEPVTSPFERMNVVVVSRKAPRLVPPADETPRITLFLPTVNESAGYGPVMSSHMLLFEDYHRHSFASHETTNPSYAIASSLAEVLCPYYPLAGRLRAPTGARAERGKVELVCDGTGAIFLEAQANISLAQLKKLDKVYWAELHQGCTGEAAVELCPLVVQVTLLTCGGFVLSISILQSLCDSAGLLHFLYAWSEVTRLSGQNIAITEPIWAGMIPFQLPSWPKKFHFPSLELITHGPVEYMHADDHHKLRHLDTRDPRYIESSGHKPYYRDHDRGHGPGLDERLASLEERDQSFRDDIYGLNNISLSLHFLHRLKDCIPINCNKFEALAALFWRERTREISLPLSSEVVLFFPSPVPHDVHLAFYGQYGFNCMVSMQVGDLIQSDLTDIVRKMQKAKALLVDGFLDCMRKFAQLHLNAAKHAPVHVLLFTVLWHGVEEIDFGLGSPPHVPDATRLPSPVNVAVVTGAQEESIEIVVTNSPTTLAESIQLLMPPTGRRLSDSKL